VLMQAAEHNLRLIGRFSLVVLLIMLFYWFTPAVTEVHRNYFCRQKGCHTLLSLWLSGSGVMVTV
jgi:hypothetical protein